MTDQNRMLVRPVAKLPFFFILVCIGFAVAPPTWGFHYNGIAGSHIGPAYAGQLFAAAIGPEDVLASGCSRFAPLGPIRGYLPVLGKHRKLYGFFTTDLPVPMLCTST